MWTPFGYNNDQADQVWNSLKSTSGKIFLSNSHRLLKDRKHLIITAIEEKDVSQVLIGDGQKKINIAN